RGFHVTGVQTCALPISEKRRSGVMTRNRTPTQALTAQGSSESPMLPGQGESALVHRAPHGMCRRALKGDALSNQASLLDIEASRSEERRVGDAGLIRQP